VSVVRAAGLRVERTGFLIPLWLEGHMKTWHLHRAHFRLRGRIAHFGATAGALGRYVCTTQWVLAQRGVRAR
jgi:hypothetical protein